MATPTNLPASFSAGAVLTSAQMNNLRGAFRILQVVYGTTTTATVSSTTTWIDTGLSASITPQSADSKILIFASHAVYSFGLAGGGILIMRNFTTLQQHLDVNYLASGSNIVSSWSGFHLDSPATTAAITYKTAQNRTTGSGSFFTQVNSNPASLVLMEVSA